MVRGAPGGNTHLWAPGASRATRFRRPPRHCLQADRPAPIMAGMAKWLDRLLGRSSPRAEVVEAGYQISQAAQETFDAIGRLNQICRLEDPENWPNNLLAVMAHVDIAFLASFIQANEMLDGFGFALQAEWKRLADQAAKQPPMPSRSLH